MTEETAALKAFAIERSRDPAEGLSARERALMACIVIPSEIQKWMVEAGAVEPLLDSIEKTILAAEQATQPTKGLREALEQAIDYAEIVARAEGMPADKRARRLTATATNLDGSGWVTAEFDVKEARAAIHAISHPNRGDAG